MRAAVPAARRVEVLVNTHANGDHCFGNQLVEGAVIVASRACAEEMRSLPPSVLAALMRSAGDLGAAGGFLREAFGAFDFEGITLTPPGETFEGRHTCRLGDTRVNLIEVGPAHTRGDVLVEVPRDRVVFTGDILFADAHPVIWEGPIGNWIAACDVLLGMDVDVVVPGHGPVSDRGGVRALRDYLAYIAREARARFDAGMPAREAARDISLSDYASWGDPERIAVNVATLYREFGDTGPEPTVIELFGWMAELARDRSH
jgi:glyoxylase-like metal-dependent hydrolase (beta-lactamase superfamily II)